MMNNTYYPKPEAIIFDWDGVLVESLDFIKQAFQFTLEKIQPIQEIDVNSMPSLSLRNYFPSVFGDKAKKAEDVFYDYIASQHLKVLAPTLGAGDLLRSLYDLQIPLCIISNKKGELLRKEVDYLSWTGYFRGIIGAGDCVEDKPSSVPVMHVLGPLGLAPSKSVWFIGDTSVDMECASQSGCFGVLMCEEKKYLNNKGIASDMVVFSCKDLKGKLINNKI